MTRQEYVAELEKIRARLYELSRDPDNRVIRVNGTHDVASSLCIAAAYINDARFALEKARR